MYPSSCAHHKAGTHSHTESVWTYPWAHLHVGKLCFHAYSMCMCSPRLCWRLTMPPSVHLRSSRFRWALRRLVTDTDGWGKEKSRGGKQKRQTNDKLNMNNWRRKLALVTWRQHYRKERNSNGKSVNNVGFCLVREWWIKSSNEGSNGRRLHVLRHLEKLTVL